MSSSSSELGLAASALFNMHAPLLPSFPSLPSSFPSERPPASRPRAMSWDPALSLLSSIAVEPDASAAGTLCVLMKSKPWVAQRHRSLSVAAGRETNGGADSIRTGRAAEGGTRAGGERGGRVEGGDWGGRAEGGGSTRAGGEMTRGGRAEGGEMNRAGRAQGGRQRSMSMMEGKAMMEGGKDDFEGKGGGGGMMEGGGKMMEGGGGGKRQRSASMMEGGFKGPRSAPMAEGGKKTDKRPRSGSIDKRPRSTLVEGGGKDGKRPRGMSIEKRPRGTSIDGKRPRGISMDKKNGVVGGGESEGEGEDEEERREYFDVEMDSYDPNRVGRYSPESRKKRVERFLEKRRRRIWRKRIKYDVRKNFADSRLRVKGRFVRKEDEDQLRGFLEMI